MEWWAVCLIVAGCIAGLAALLWAISLCVNPRVLDLDGKVVVITGGSSGIGLACAKEAASRGANVVLLARKKPGLDAAVAEVEPKLQGHRTVTPLSADVTDEESCGAAMEAVARLHGRIHMLILSAGISEPGEFTRTSQRVWDRVFAVNVRGSRTAVLSALPLLSAAGAEEPAGSRVCFVSSGAGLTGLYGFTAYCASKFALLGLAQTLQQELLTSGVRVGVHFPPDTDTPLLAAENEVKPKLTKQLSETIAVVSAADVARTLVRDSCRGMFLSAHDWISWLLVQQTAGMSPTPTVGELFWQTLLGGFPLKLVAFATIVEWFGKIRSKHEELVKPVVDDAPLASRLAAAAAAGGHALPGIVAGSGGGDVAAVAAASAVSGTAAQDSDDDDNDDDDDDDDASGGGEVAGANDDATANVAAGSRTDPLLPRKRTSSNTRAN